MRGKMHADKSNEIKRDVTTKIIIWVLKHHQLMGIDEAGLCCRFPIRNHQWVSPFVSFSLP